MIVISWQPVVTATSYLIQSGSTPTGSWGTVATVASGSGYSSGSYSYSFDADPLTWFQIIAVDDLGQQSVPSPAFLPGETVLYDGYTALLVRVKDFIGETSTTYDGVLTDLLRSVGAEVDSATGQDIQGEFGFIPQDIQQAVVEYVALKFNDRLSKDKARLPSYATKAITDVLDRYRYQGWRFGL